MGCYSIFVFGNGKERWVYEEKCTYYIYGVQKYATNDREKERRNFGGRGKMKRFTAERRMYACCSAAG